MMPLTPSYQLCVCVCVKERERELCMCMHVYMFTYMQVHMCVQLSMHTCAYARGGQRQTLSIFFNCSPPYKLRQGLSPNPELIELTHLLWESPIPVFSVLGLQLALIPKWDYMGSVVQTPILMSASRVSFFCSANLPSPIQVLKLNILPPITRNF